MRWLVLLLLVGCLPHRVGGGVTYDDAGGSFRSSSSASGYKDNLSSVLDVDEKPSWGGYVNAEWDIGVPPPKFSGDSWLPTIERPPTKHEEQLLDLLRESNVKNQAEEEPDHEEHSYWQEKLDQVLGFRWEKLVAVLAFLGLMGWIFREPLKRQWKKRFGKGKGAE